MLEITDKEFKKIIEGKTKLIVPSKSMIDKTPPKEPAFFNPRAQKTRDFSIIAYGAFLKNYQGPKLFLEGFSGLGARGIRVANELQFDKVIINDLNPNALKIARNSAKLNNLKNLEFSEKEICSFFSNYSKKGCRGTIVDIDPFGSPAPYFDCGIRATMHGGILSVTATDLQVLNGLFQNACKRRYGGIPVRTEYGNEIAIRLILGCLRTVAARLDIEILPLYVESDMHYYRVYVQIFNRPDQEENLGYILHCFNCNNREISLEQKETCSLCNSKIKVAGPLWVKNLFNKDFVEKMAEVESELSLGKNYHSILTKCLKESEINEVYFTLDEVASIVKQSPPKLEDAISDLQKYGFKASPTAFSPTGFKTNARIDEITKIIF